ncbi:MAG: hypothetical protein CSB55_00070 [Candidatus Cloacimonadota bacterium]|nr:MAG: hypothetical protein CSB55_00070 [Candidatus Cloacimonadota bacterium]
MIRSKKKTIRNYDIFIPVCAFLLGFIGILFIQDIGAVGTNFTRFYKHALFFLLSFFPAFFFSIIPLNFLKKTAPLWMLLCLILLISVLCFGNDINGAKRFLKIWKLSFQPSTLARIVLIWYVARTFANKKDLIKNASLLDLVKRFWQIFVFTPIFYLLILYERHFSILVISSATLFCMFFIARVRILNLLIMLSVALIAGFGVISFGASYRSARIKIFKRYNLYMRSLSKSVKHENLNDKQIRQSLIALSNGGFFGKGFDEGMAKENYLSEAETDYIFSVIGEEFGFLGSIIVFLLYCFLFFRTVQISYHADDLFLKLASLGLGLNIFINAMINIGVSMSSLPSTGVTLPFISYGGTSLVVNSIGIGLLMNISAEVKR